MSSHSIYSPSSAYRWNQCPGSIKLSAKCPSPPPSNASIEGTNAHLTAEQAMREGKSVQQITGRKDAYSRNIQGYVDYVQTLSTGALLKEIELQVTLPTCPEVYGTADAVIYTGQELHVIDFKYGRWQVDAKDNPQLMIYTLGAISHVRERFDEWTDRVQVFNHIYQPRAAKPIQRVQVDLDLLRDFEAYVMESVALSKRDDPPLVDGEWCRFCQADLICPRLNGTGRIIT